MAAQNVARKKTSNKVVTLKHVLSVLLIEAMQGFVLEKSPTWANLAYQ